MRRRDFVKGILAASAAAKAMSAQQAAAPGAQATPPAASPAMPPQGPVAPGPMPWNRGLLEAPQLGLRTLVPDAVAETNAHFFNQTQTATLRRLCALLMPPLKGFPGALDTGTPEFLDFLIGASPRRQQLMYKSGLDWLDTEAKAKFAMTFENTTDTQADALIRPWLRIWMTDHAPTELHAAFINQVHSDIRTATMNSQEWSDAQLAAGKWRDGYDLYWYPVDPNLHDEPNAVLGRPAMPVAPAPHA